MEHAYSSTVFEAAMEGFPSLVKEEPIELYDANLTLSLDDVQAVEAALYGAKVPWSKTYYAPWYPQKRGL